MNMNSAINFDQTQFSSQEPLMEGETALAPKPAENMAFAQEADDEARKKEAMKKAAGRKKKLLLIVIGAVVIMVGMIIVLLLMRGRSRGPQQGNTPAGIEDMNDTGEVDPLLQEVKNLQGDLEVADPTANSVPFPPVDMELRLDPAKKR